MLRCSECKKGSIKTPLYNDFINNAICEAFSKIADEIEKLTDAKIMKEQKRISNEDTINHKKEE